MSHSWVTWRSAVSGTCMNPENRHSHSVRRMLSCWAFLFSFLEIMSNPCGDCQSRRHQIVASALDFQEWLHVRPNIAEQENSDDFHLEHLQLCRLSWFSYPWQNHALLAPDSKPAVNWQLMCKIQGLQNPSNNTAATVSRPRFCRICGPGF